MAYIHESDRQYILGKYHKLDGTFDSHNRFIRNDEYFDSSTGMDGDALVANLLLQDEQIAGQPHAIRKAKAFAYVLKHTRINCDAHDRFPHINAMDRPINKALIKRWKAEVLDEIIPEVGQKRRCMEKDGVATIWPDFDHIVPDWDRVFELGFSGLLHESEQAKNLLSQTHDLSETEIAFFDSVAISYQAIFDLIRRLANQAGKVSGCMRMSAALERLIDHAPQTFYEALLLDYLLFILCEHIEGIQVRSLGNLDRLLYPLYKRDLEYGVSKEELCTDLAHFFMQFTAIGNYWNQPVYLGGCKADGTTEINPFSYVFLDVHNALGIYNPKIQIKVASNTPKDFLLKALDMIRHGNNSIVFVSDALLRRALMNAGASEEDARTCNVKGCYEYNINGGLDTGMNYVNFMKPLEYCLHEGCDGVTGKQSGLPCCRVEEYASFEQLFKEYKRQLLYMLDEVMDVVNRIEDYLEYINPQPVMSSTYITCLQHGKDCMCGGAKSNESNMACGFLADVADSLTIIYKYVFEQKRITLRELVTALDANFDGYEQLRLRLSNDRDKYGNNRELPDRIAKEIIDTSSSYVMGKPNARIRAGKWTCGYHVARMSYTQGKLTAASANGRRLGDELSKNVSASMGKNREGATAAILSATKLNADQFVGDAALDLGLLPSAVKGKDGLEAMYALLMTFINRGGQAMQINVFDADTLRKAQREPEKYQDLQIRVCGWNVLWNNIAKEEQDGFIRQAESLV
ncbi:pyruvate formate lyase family protein [Paenibacillus sp.]